MTDVLTALRRFVDAAPTCPDVPALVRALAAVGCDDVTATSTRRHLYVTVNTPVLARALSDALSLGDVIAWPDDVEWPDDEDEFWWRLRRIVASDRLALHHESPRAGRWAIDTLLDDGFPHRGDELTLDGGRALGTAVTVRFIRFSTSSDGVIASERVDPVETGFVRDRVVCEHIISIGRSCIPCDARLPDRVFAQAASYFAWHTQPLIELWPFMRDVGRSHGDDALYIVAPERHVEPEHGVIRIGRSATPSMMRELVAERCAHHRPAIEWVFGRNRRFAMFADHEAGLVVTATTRPYFHFEEAEGADLLVPFTQAAEHAALRLPPHDRDAWRSRLISSYPGSWPR